jgi:5-methylcytosine-specific restriction endonuclease McrA
MPFKTKEQKEQKDKYNRDYYLKNREKILGPKKQYYETNIEQIKQYREDNKEMLAKKNKQYHESNKELIAIRKKQWYMDTKEARLTVHQHWYALNRELIIKKRLAWQKVNKDKVNVIAQRRRTRKHLLPSNLTFEQWGETKLHFDNKCAYCGKELPLVQEHFIALSKSGEYTINNIIPACMSCNNSKGNKDFFEWYPKYRHYSKKREKIVLKFLNYKNNIHQLALAF